MSVQMREGDLLVIPPAIRCSACPLGPLLSPPARLLPLCATPTRYEKISEKKMATPTESLCKGFPTEFVVFFQ